MLSYFRRWSQAGTTGSSRPPSYAYSRTSTLRAEATAARFASYGGLGTGRTREDQVRRESQGLLAHTGRPEDLDDEEDQIGSPTSPRPEGDPRFALGPAHDRQSSDDDLDDLDVPITPAVIGHAHISQRGATRHEPRLVHALSEFGSSRSSSPSNRPEVLQPPPRLQLGVEGKRTSISTDTSSRSTYYSAPSTPSLVFTTPAYRLPPLPLSAFAPAPTDQYELPFEASHAAGLGSDVPTVPSAVDWTASGSIPDIRETVHLLPRQPSSQQVQLSSAFRHSSSTSFAPSRIAQHLRGSQGKVVGDDRDQPTMQQVSPLPVRPSLTKLPLKSSN